MLIQKLLQKSQYPFKHYEKAPTYLSKFETNTTNEQAITVRRKLAAIQESHHDKAYLVFWYHPMKV